MDINQAASPVILRSSDASLSKNHYPLHPCMPSHPPGNVSCLLSLREADVPYSARTKPCKQTFNSSEIGRWAESNFFRCFTSVDSGLGVAPRSTIAAAFSSDGGLVSSTHGDHTVKITCARRGTCLCVLSGHRRTPWVVRFHPFNHLLVASGSLDHEVRIWRTDTGTCIRLWDFGRPIASLAFHCDGSVVAVASGHRLYFWEHGIWCGRFRKPVVSLRTRKSLRAVHFHPQGSPFILTAEVQENHRDPIKNFGQATNYDLQQETLQSHPYPQSSMIRLGSNMEYSEPMVSVPMGGTRRGAISLTGQDEPANDAQHNGPRQAFTGHQDLDVLFRNLDLHTWTPGSHERSEALAAAAVGAAAVVGQELLSTVKVKIWEFESRDNWILNNPQIILQSVVLCSEMGIHFSSCGRYLVACVALTVPGSDNCISCDQTGSEGCFSRFCELRLYSMEPGHLGMILGKKQVKAAQCVTSIQFSPAGDHILLAYGRRHTSLQSDDQQNTNALVPVHIVLEVYRTCDMSRALVLTSAEDEVNVAAFNPICGEGVVYGTKEGRLRYLRHRGLVLDHTDHS